MRRMLEGEIPLERMRETGRVGPVPPDGNVKMGPVVTNGCGKSNGPQEPMPREKHLQKYQKLLRGKQRMWKNGGVGRVHVRMPEMHVKT